MTTVQIEGFKELERALVEELPKATARNVLRRTAVNAIEPIREGMTERAPFDPEDRDQDGQHLKETMRVQVAGARLARAVGVSRQQGVLVLAGPAPVGQRARANAGWQEFGTLKMPPKGYARSTADDRAHVVIDNARDELAAQIDKAKARIARKAARRG